MISSPPVFHKKKWIDIILHPNGLLKIGKLLFGGSHLSETFFKPCVFGCKFKLLGEAAK